MESCGRNIVQLLYNYLVVLYKPTGKKKQVGDQKNKLYIKKNATWLHDHPADVINYMGGVTPSRICDICIYTC